MEMPVVEGTRMRGKTEAELQNEVAQLKVLAEAKVRIWRAANAATCKRHGFGWRMLHYFWKGLP